MSQSLVVSEVFGPTFQGEGTSVGRRCGFVRLGVCNLTCTWCDTSYTWDWKRFDRRRELHLMSPDAVLEQLDTMDVDMVVITGGEPLLQQRRLRPLLEGIRERAWRIEVETNGTIAPDHATAALVDRFNVSPKLDNSGVALADRVVPAALRSFRDGGQAVFKFVVEEPEELDEVAAMVDEHGLQPVVIMPEGTDAEVVVARLRSLAEPVLKRGWSLSPRLHVLIWGDRRGV